MEIPRDALPFLVLHPLGFGSIQISTELLETSDHLTLRFVQPRILDGHRGLVGKRRKQPLVFAVYPGILFATPIIPMT